MGPTNNNMVSMKLFLLKKYDLLESFKQDIEELLNFIYESINKGDQKKLQYYLHKLKGLLCFTNLEVFEKIIKSFEEAIEKEKHEEYMLYFLQLEAKKKFLLQMVDN